MTGPTSANVGNDVSYSFTVTNNSTTTTATNVAVAVGYGGGYVGLAYYSVPGGYCNIGGGASCYLNSIAPGGSVTFTLSGTAATLGAVTINATVSAGVPDPNPSNNSASLTLNGNPGPHLTIAMTAPAALGASPTAPTWNFAYTITVQNTGGGASDDVVIVDDLPRVYPTGFAGASSSVGTCTVAGSTAVDNFQACFAGGPPCHDQVRCDLGSLAAGATATVTITESWNGGGPAGPVSNSAVLIAAVGSAPTASATIVFNGTDVSLAMSGPATAPVNTNFNYVFTLANAGPASVPRTDLNLSLSGASFVSAAGATCELGYPAYLVGCYYDGLGPGQSVNVTVTLQASAVGTAGVSANIDLQNAYDTNASNNSASRSTTITGP
jgi:hypothetical protein